MVTLALLLIALTPHDSVARDRCEIIDRNSFYDGDGRLVFVQFIFWQTDGRCRAWVMDKGQVDVRRDYDSKQWVARWCADGTRREMWATTFDESHTQYDPELLDRELLPVAERRPLAGR